MLRRPSSRRKSHSDTVELNLIPIMDTMVTLIGFLLFTTAFMTFHSIDSPLPQSSPIEAQKKQPLPKPLQLTLTIRDHEVEIWSPFNKIQPQKIPNTPDGQPDSKTIHEILLAIKKQFPEESTLVLIPILTTGYQTLISMMDTARSIDPSDPPLYAKNQQTGVDEPLKNLFPKVIFGNLLGDH